MKKTIKTKNYDMFVFREDNREKIDQVHVGKLINSISSKNLLELRPISVNEKMEIIDGQHRLLAAKHLNVDIYYNVEELLKSEDIILMNICKSWGLSDYLNYYRKNEKEDYKKLYEFMKTNNLNLKIALNIQMGRGVKGYDHFKKGEFKFSNESIENELNYCQETIEIIKKNNGYSPYTYSTRFWKALIKLTRHPNFNHERWLNNLKKMVEICQAKLGEKDYCKMFMNIYNLRTSEKINLFDDQLNF